ncbi:MAG: MarR family transcriptional regulator [Euryarchaeota archaeon]|nr:MarR family transcriptional regulator [Euryarchaeota archaeon]
MSALEKVFGRTAQMTGLSHSSVSKVIEPLLAIGIITEKKVGKQIRTFTLNEENPLTIFLLNFYDGLTELLPD